MKKFSQYLEELAVRDPSGKKVSVSKEPVRMVTGKMKMMYPAKSSSSKGGE